MRQWESLEELFGFMDKNVKYAVLRNGNEIMDSGYCVTGDIDILCERKSLFAMLIGAKPRVKQRLNRCSYFVMVDSREVAIDIYEPGDGYYDRKWQKDMLKRRRKSKAGIYVLDDVNLFYSLAYHALYQKEKILPKHTIQLKSLLAVKWNGDVQELKIMLEKFMADNGYKYTYPYTPTYVNFSEVSPERIYKAPGVYVIELLRKICAGGGCFK